MTLLCVDFRQCKEGEGAGCPPALIRVRGHEGRELLISEFIA